MLEMSDQQQNALKDCQTDLRGLLKPSTLQSLVDVDGACFDRLDRESSLVTSRIRHNAYVIQQQQTRQLMWMVVGITLAGVMLAGLQLAAGFRLAMLGKASFENSQSGSFDVEAKKLSINSSVSGVLVLALSLCFFYIFTQNIYLIQNPDTKKGNSGIDAMSSSMQTLPTSSESPGRSVPLKTEVEKEAERETGHSQ
jgi:hypothetical protein